MKNKKYIALLIVLVSIGTFQSTDSFSEPLEGKYCVREFSCGARTSASTIPINVSDYDEYLARDEGIVEVSGFHHENLFKSLEKVLKVSDEEYSETIQEILDEDSFEELYQKYVSTFNKNYSTEIDDSFAGDYVQNIGELILNKYHGDCDDYATWLYIIAKAKGLEVRYVIGYSETKGHAWIQIKVDGEWIDYNSTRYQIGKDVVSQNYLQVYYYGGDEDE